MRIVWPLALAAIMASNAAFADERNDISDCIGADADLALAGCSRIIETGAPSSDTMARAFYYRGLVYAAKREYGPAIADYDQAIRLNPEYAEAFNDRGIADYARGDYDWAIADYSEAIRLKPGYAEAFNNRANAYDAKGDHDRAMADYDQAIRLKPDFADAFYNRGTAYDDRGDYNKAIADKDSAILIKPDDADAFYNRGNIYNSIGDHDRAIADYNQAIRLKPDYAQAFNNRGTAYNAKGDYDKAIADYDQSIRLEPDLAKPWANRGIALWDGPGDDERAVADLEQALKLNPNLAYAKAKLGEIKGYQDGRRAALTGRAVPGRRVALVIGNAAYNHGLDKLPNVQNDIEEIVRALQRLGYEVEPHHDVRSSEMKGIIRRFAVTVAPTAEAVLIWYSGHGRAFQVSADSASGRSAQQNDNFLLPVDFAAADDPSVKAVTVGTLRNAVLAAGKLRILVIDACRSGGGAKGPAGFTESPRPTPMAPGVTPRITNTLVVYSTQPGQSAGDGPKGGHAPITQAFLDLISHGEARKDARVFFQELKWSTFGILDEQTPEVIDSPFDPPGEYPLAPAKIDLP